MLLNFCDSSLKTDVNCSTVCSEGHDVKNLVNNSGKGFLAYTCIRPPVHIEFTFICNIQICFVKVWPQVGAQKSSGFRLLVKSSNDKSIDFTDVSSVFLAKNETGVLFYRRDLHDDLNIDSSPPGFSQRYIRVCNVNNYVNVMRLSIVKTDNSVPAVGRIEIWGRVSKNCGRDVVANIMNLWTCRSDNISISEASKAEDQDQKLNIVEKEEQKDTCYDNLDVPEEFLDPITFQIMTQPIVLPSGKIIDQKTLDKFGETEAKWGRSISDPFTGILFNQTRKPIIASSLKSQIDQFLSENCNREEIKKMPRVLGRKNIFHRNKDIQAYEGINISKDPGKRKFPYEDVLNKSKRPILNHSLPLSIYRKKNDEMSHTVPINQSLNSKNTSNNFQSNRTQSEINSSLKLEIQSILANSKVNTGTQTLEEKEQCHSNTNEILYKLPCNHLIGRKFLLEMTNDYKCLQCNVNFTASDPIRVFL